MEDLKELRKEIDRIDQEIVKLFEERMNIVLKIAEYKKINNISIGDANREKEVIRKNMVYLKDSYYEKWIEEFLKNMMDISKNIQKEKISEKE